ncbi:unnamed protein product, partial [marine sediment metagenome]
AVEAGDYIGCYFTGGLFRRDLALHQGVWKWDGEKIDPGDEATYTLGADEAISLYGYGDILPPGLPTVTTQDASLIEETTATNNGNITATGNETCDKRGVVYDTTNHGDPGNTAPAGSAYAHFEEETDGFGTGSFTTPLISLSPGTKYYARAYAHNENGYSYGE